MDAAAVGGAFLSAFLQVLFDGIASPQVVGLFNTRRLNDGLLKKLKTTLISVNGLLDDAEEKEITKPAVKQWLDELKDAVYEADDFLDEVAYEALRSEMEAESQTSRENTNNLSCRLSDVFGRDDDKENIVKLLLDDGNGSDLGVIPIVGNKRYFKAVAGETCDTKNADEIQVGLKERLMGKRFLLVLDYVWYAKYTDWDILQRPLKYGAKGSKIVVTTRNESVALIMRTVPSHYLKELSHDDCWLLFVRHAFENGNSDAYPDLEVIGRKLVKKGDGLALAAKVLGGLMRSKKKDVNEWDAVLQSNMWDLASQNILPTLRLSYYLPSHSKQCFAYCAIFPQGYAYKKEELVLLWMAEGLLVPSRGNTDP
ncbi:hypothetical protein GH714_006781 [Hevea brasiliensis]|uniref:Disease resistance RPP13-like protein 1 n=1 Tax=Hevea brasiliensis TaxID=3981 RepID=A0A6A6LF06_HEVBR|nr:hypothetical protein GH714_006781 [Hevea brasiliensis]